MKKIFAFIIFLLFLVLVWLSWNWYKNTVACCSEVENIAVVEYGPLIFDCSNDDPITNDLWSDKKNEIIAGKTVGKKLLIVGPYFGDENKTHGIARANKVKALLMPELSADDIVVDSRFGGDCEKTKSNLMHELLYKWVYRNSDIIEQFDKTVVNYKFDSTQEITSENTLIYINDLVAALKSSKDTVRLTGHTDAEGTEEYNMKLGMDRANEFKNHLIRLGVDPGQILVESKGKSMPISDNSTAEGRKQNRRIEVHIINKN